MSHESVLSKKERIRHAKYYGNKAAIERERIMTTGDLLDALLTALLKREKFWSEARENAHGIATAVMVALAEVRAAVEEVIEEDEGQQHD